MIIIIIVVVVGSSEYCRVKFRRGARFAESDHRLVKSAFTAGRQRLFGPLRRRLIGRARVGSPITENRTENEFARFFPRLLLVRCRRVTRSTPVGQQNKKKKKTYTYLCPNINLDSTGSVGRFSVRCADDADLSTAIRIARTSGRFFAIPSFRPA